MSSEASSSETTTQFIILLGTRSRFSHCTDRFTRERRSAMLDQNRMAARAAQLKLQAEEAPWRGLTIGGLAVGGIGALFVRYTSLWFLLVAALIGAGAGLYLGLRRRARLNQMFDRAQSNLDRADNPSTRIQGD